ncbi:hypothetical protein, partial [Streptomyces corynorhini]|uniref:hypothetical protein n=1 Tax=Streptomyces corynorhini TaxID=2282652 RepID=UPI00389A9737
MRTSSHPMASAGYGKRSAVGQPASSVADFALLPGREAAIAGFIDRLPDGADISVKALAKVMDYGQCALRTALNFLERAGHLLRKREFLVGASGGRWVTRTWFSRTARGDGPWDEDATAGTAVDAGGSGTAGTGTAGTGTAGTGTAGTGTGTAPAPAPGTWAADRPTRSRGYLLLASLGRRCPALSLSAADCAALEPLAAEWFVREAREEDVLRALTDGLPTPVHHPAGLVRSRLTAKLPPEPTDPQPLPSPVAPAMVECDTCRAPGRP